MCLGLGEGSVFRGPTDLPEKKKNTEGKLKKEASSMRQSFSKKFVEIHQRVGCAADELSELGAGVCLL